MPLKLAILESGRSQMEIAAATGIHYSQISLIVRGWREPSPEQRARLSAVLGRKPEALFGTVA
jgi:plasmid maintenance system antidote protein VapI